MRDTEIRDEIPLPPAAAPDRRQFLIRAAAAGGGLLVSGWFPASAQERGVVDLPPQPHVFLRIDPDNMVTVTVKHLDMGQGVVTGLATVVAEELDVEWSQMRYEYAPADIGKFRNGRLGVQGTGASTSMANSWMELRKAGAAARALLLTAAAAEWSVPPQELVAERGRIRHAVSGREATYGFFAARAALFPVPADVSLKQPGAFRLIGTTVPRRLDSRSKSTGTEKFGMDLRLPNMAYAVLARPPKFGASLLHVDDSSARATAGVVDVVRTRYGVAVLATDTWSAIQGRKRLRLQWDFSAAEQRSSNQMQAALRELATQPGPAAKRQGEVEAALAKAQHKLEAEYQFPFLAHAPLEPLNATVELTPEGAILHTGCQFHTVDQGAVAQELDLKPEQVRIVTLMAGGTFGRRANPTADYVREAAAVAKAYGKAAVQLVWTREDDLHGGYYRSMFVHRVRTGADANGLPLAWDHRVAGHSIAEGTGFARFLVKNGIDHTSEEGSYENKYGVPNFNCEVHAMPKTVPVLWWRSVGHSHGAYVVETLIDEMATRAGQDSLAYRLARLPADSRLARVLRLAASQAGWGRRLPRGQGLGIAAHESFGSFVAHVAQVRLGRDRRLKVERVVCAVDCGTVVNPDVVRAQMEGGVAFALSALLYQAITFKDGFVEQDNFHQFPLLRMREMPQVEVHIVPSAEPPSGIGEPPVPTVGPAVANALFAAGGPRVRTLPFSAAGIKV